MTQSNELIILSRDIDALLIPSGAPIQLPRYTEVRITQALGDTFTVNVYGNLARVDGKDADALGKAPVDSLADIDYESMSLEEIAMLQLKTCYDPEIPVNIVDLGLIYACDVLPLGADEHSVKIQMTLTAPGCGMGPVLMEEMKRKVARVKGVTQVDVELVFEPPWDRSMVSEAAQLQLGIF